jgi:hypothetical protein
VNENDVSIGRVEWKCNLGFSPRESRYYGYLDCVWRDGDRLYGSIVLYRPLPWKEFLVLGSVMTTKPMRLLEVLLTPPIQPSLWPEWNVQSELSKVGLIKAGPISHCKIESEDLDGILRNITERGMSGYKVPVVVWE